MRERGIASFVVSGIAIMSVLAPSSARAQAPPASAQTTAQAPAQTPGAQPAPAQPAKPPEPAHKFTGNFTAGISLESGQTDLNATQLVFQGQRPYSKDGTFTTKVAYTRATTRPPGSPTEITVADRFEANAGIENNYGKRGVLMVRFQALRDPIQKIDYEVEGITGFGVRLVNQRVQVRIVPGIALISHDKNIQVENGFNVNWGVYQDAKIAVAKGWQFTEYINASKDIKDKDDYVLSVYGSLTGAITKRFGLQLSYQYNYTKLLPVGVEPWYQKVVTGIQINF